ncbi:MAG: S8 family serine peptidase [Chloroflexi bacterium]|nr:S8 family serine peptidase [Chloroflexota bacterium]
MNRNKGYRIVILALVILFLLGRSNIAYSSEQSLEWDLGGLKAQADQDGTVRVIVGLDIGKPFVPEGNLPNEQAREGQRRAIANAQNGLLNALAGQNANLNRIFEYIPYIALEVDENALQGLENNPMVVSIEEDALIEAILENSVPVIGGDVAHLAGWDGSGQTVAVIDTGVNADHPYLSGQVVSEACYSNLGGGGGGLSLCPNGTSSQTGAGAANPDVGECMNGFDTKLFPAGLCGHGSHVSGIVASTNGTRTGVAPDASLIGIQVFTRFNDESVCDPFPPDPGDQAPCILAFTSDIISGLSRTYDLRGTYTIASVNMSLGGGKYTSEATCDADNGSTKAIIDTLASVNIATIVASGNAGYTDGLSYPACISTAISVGATNNSDSVASFSNNASFLDFYAPGVSIISAWSGEFAAQASGTSMASPHVAGAWAVMREKCPSASIAEILAAFNTTGVPITHNSITKPRIQLDAALEQCISAAPTNVAASDGSSTSFVQVSWDSVTDASSYEIWSSTIDDSGTAVKVGDVASSPFDDSATVPLISYYYWVKACNVNVCSDFSIGDDGWRADSIPAAPTGVSATDGVYPDKVVVDWDSDIVATSYEVWRDTDAGGATMVPVGSPTSNSYDDTSAIDLTTYYYWVKACSALLGCSDAFSTPDDGFADAAAAANIWYLAEGFTGDGFATFILLQNTTSTDANVAVTYSIQGGGQVVRNHVVPANSRYTIVTHDPAEVGVDKAFSTKINTNQALIVERAMYFANGAHGTTGVKTPATTWYLAEGFTGDGFLTFILLQNITDTDANVTVTYSIEGGVPVDKVHVVPANSRYTILTNDDAQVGLDQAFSTVIVSDQLLIVERAMYYANGAHNSPGLTLP